MPDTRDAQTKYCRAAALPGSISRGRWRTGLRELERVPRSPKRRKRSRGARKQRGAGALIPAGRFGAAGMGNKEPARSLDERSGWQVVAATATRGNFDRGFIPQPPAFDLKGWDAVLLVAIERHQANYLRAIAWLAQTCLLQCRPQPRCQPIVDLQTEAQSITARGSFPPPCSTYLSLKSVGPGAS